MQKDFYLDEHGVASYFEKDWMDFVIQQGGENQLQYRFAPSPALHLTDDYHVQFAKFVSSQLLAHKIRPGRMLEVGSSLGRTFYEITKEIPSVQPPYSSNRPKIYRGLSSRSFCRTVNHSSPR